MRVSKKEIGILSTKCCRCKSYSPAPSLFSRSLLMARYLQLHLLGHHRYPLISVTILQQLKVQTSCFKSYYGNSDDECGDVDDGGRRGHNDEVNMLMLVLRK